MSHNVTPAAARRIAEREEFVDITPGPYLTIEGPEGLPRISIDLHGRDESTAFAETVVGWIRAGVARDAPALSVKQRSAA